MGILNIENHNAPKRSFLLWFLAICTMVNAGVNVLTFSIYMLFPQVLQQSVAVMQGMPMFNNEQYMQVFEMYLSIKSWQYGLLIIAEAAIFIGALVMLWKLNPIGFHIYSIGQIALICVQNFVIGGKMKMNVSTILLTALLIVMYATQLRYMRRPEEAEEPEELEEPREEEED